MRYIPPAFSIATPTHYSIYIYIFSYCLYSVGVDADNPGVKAFQQHYSTLQNALDSHINLIVSSSYSQRLISADMNATITCTPSMPSGDKVSLFLSTVEERIAEDHQLVNVFAEVLNQGSYLSVIGSDLKKTYREYFPLSV